MTPVILTKVGTAGVLGRMAYYLESASFLNLV